MPTLLEQLENNLGSCMSGNLYFDFGYIESAVHFLKNNRGHKPTSRIKNILNQFINNHVTNQNYTVKNPDGTYLEYPLSGAIEYCFNAWWKNQPAPRSLAQQKAECDAREEESRGQYRQTPPFLSYDEVYSRIKSVQDDIELHDQMYGWQDQDDQPFKGENEALANQLLSKPEEACNAWSLFRNVTSGQLDSELESLGIVDKTTRNQVKRHILVMCKDPHAITSLSDNELPLQMDEVAEWIYSRLDGAAVYMQDSKTWYYRRGNKYISTPDYREGDPVNNAMREYFDFCTAYSSFNPLQSLTITQVKKELLKQRTTLKEFIGTVETHTEEEFNEKVLTPGLFCTPNGLYDYTHKVSDSNGLTKVTTKANILNMLDQEIDASEGVQLFAQFMTQIQPDQETRNYLIGVIANAITGHRENEYTYIFHGSTGANGKSVLMALLQDMLGDYYADYSTDCIVRNARGSAELAAMNLENRRLVGGREIGDGSTIDGGAFKRYFSNDSYRINPKYKNPYDVKPTHTMFLPVNQMPNFGSDPAVRRRLVVIPFTEHFVTNPNPKNPHEHKLDPTILKKLIAHEDEIFTYLVRYAEQLREENITLRVPATIQHYGDEMVDENNALADFMSVCGNVQTEGKIADNTIPTPITTGAKLFAFYLAYVAFTGIYNPYKTYKSFISALMLKYPQLGKPKNTRTKDNKIVKAFHGVWLDPTTTIAKQVAANRWDKETLQVAPFPDFEQNDIYEKWEAMDATINQAEQYANGDMVKTLDNVAREF